MADPTSATGGNMPDPTPETSSSLSGEEKAANLQSILDILKRINAGNELANEQERTLGGLVKLRATQLQDISSSMVGLRKEQREEAVEAMHLVESNAKQLEIAEKYLGVADGTTKKDKERLDVLRAIEAVGKGIGFSQDEIAKAQALTEKKFRTEDLTSRMGELASGAGQALAMAGKLINVQFQSDLLGMMGKGRTLMQGANIGGATSQGAQALSNTMFGAASGVMDPIARMTALNKVLADSPRAAEESAASMRTLIGTMAYFGASTEQVTQTLIKGRQAANLGADALAQMTGVASGMSKDLGLSTSETSEDLLNMYTALRQVGGTVKQSEQILGSFRKAVDGTNHDLSALEKAALGLKVAAGLASVPIEKMIGLVQFTTGKSITQQTAADLGNGNVVAAFQKTFDKISRGMGQSTGEQLIATEKVAQLFGINVSSFQEVSTLMKELKSGTLTQQNIDDLADPATRTAAGIAQLEQTIGPLQKIEIYTKNMEAMMTRFFVPLAALQGIVPALAALKMGGSLLGGTKIASAATEAVLGTEVGAAGATAMGIGAAALSEFAVPLVLGATAATAIGYGLKQHYSATVTR